MIQIGVARVPGASAEALHRAGRRVLARLDGGEKKPIATEPGGKPFFPDHHAAFSISHSGEAAAVAYLRGVSLRLGCDIQRMSLSRDRTAISRRFFAPPEQAYIEGLAAGFFPHFPRFYRFYHIWVLKEAFLKARGWSIAGISRAPAFSLQPRQSETGTEMRITAEGGRYFLFESAGKGEEDRYALALAVDSAEETAPPRLVRFGPAPAFSLIGW